MKPTLRWLGLCGIVLVVAMLHLQVAYTQNSLTIPWATINNGGGLSSHQNTSIRGTIGQGDAQLNLRGGDFKLNGGYWAGIRPRYQQFLPFSMRGEAGLR